MRKYAPLAVITAIAFAVAPVFVASMAATVAIFGFVAFGGAWLVDRYGSLPGGDGRCA